MANQTVLKSYERTELLGKAYIKVATSGKNEGKEVVKLSWLGYPKNGYAEILLTEAKNITGIIVNLADKTVTIKDGTKVTVRTETLIG